MIKNTLLFFVCFLMFTPLAHADIGKTMCDALSDDKTYKDDKSYKKLIPGKDGLLHISEIKHERVEKVEDVLKEGEMIDVKLIAVDPKTGKLKLSRKVLLEKPAKQEV